MAWVQLLLGAVAIVLAVLSFLGADANRNLQKVAGDNQARIDRASTFATLDNSLVQLMAKTAADTNDAALTTLLSTNGITFHKAPVAAAPGAK